MFGGINKMEKDLYYTIEENGYHIYDRNDPLFHIHQYEPYIPDHSKSYEENAIAQIEELTKEPEPEPTEQLYTLDEAAAVIAKEASTNGYDA